MHCHTALHSHSRPCNRNHTTCRGPTTRMCVCTCLWSLRGVRAGRTSRRPLCAVQSAGGLTCGLSGLHYCARCCVRVCIGVEKEGREGEGDSGEGRGGGGRRGAEEGRRGRRGRDVTCTRQTWANASSRRTTMTTITTRTRPLLGHYYSALLRTHHQTIQSFNIRFISSTSTCHHNHLLSPLSSTSYLPSSPFLHCSMTHSYPPRPPHSLIGGNAFGNESPTSSLDHTSGDSFTTDASSEVATTSNAAAPGLYISAPLSPPVGYPMPGSGHQAMRAPTPVAEDPRASVISSSSSGSSHGGSTKGSGTRPTPPQWAQPPKKTGNRASSFDSGLDRGVVERPQVLGVAEHNPEQFRGPAGEWVEILRGEQGRIAIKSTTYQYEVLAWLPHFR